LHDSVNLSYAAAIAVCGPAAAPLTIVALGHDATVACGQNFTPDSETTCQRRPWSLPAVIEAGALEMRYFRNGVTVDHKSDASPVTAADREAEAILLAALARVAPGIPVIAEEAASAGHIPAIATDFFLVDPLDGTREFVSGSEDFTVNIALVRDGRPIFGIVYAPATGQLYAGLGSGQQPGSAIAVIVPAAAGHVRHLAELRPRLIQCRVPQLDALTVVSSRSHRTAAVEEFLSPFNVRERRHIGSSLKFVTVARGDADLYPRIGSINEWDTAAGHAVLAAAGGTVTTFDGSPLMYGKTAANFLNPDFIAWGSADLAKRLLNTV
jgi:3'(2'), 5'-bisphosphate nucleotidase